MKKFLALVLAVFMVASGSVLALAAETPAETTTPTETTEPTTPTEPATPTETATPEETTPGGTIDRNAPITLNGLYPGDPIYLGWSILSPNGAQSVRIATDLKIVEVDHENTTEFSSQIVETSGYFRYMMKLNKPLTSVEDVGKAIEDTIKITLEDGKTYSFPLVVTYQGGAKVQCNPQIHEFTVGQQVTLNVEVLDPTDEYALPHTAEFYQRPEDSNEYGNGPKEKWLLEVNEIKITEGEKNFSITVTPRKKGVEHVNIHTTDSNGKTYGQGWMIEVIEPGEEPAETNTMSSRSDNQVAQDAAVETIAAVNEAIASGAALPSKAQTVTTASGSSATVVPAKLYGLNANLSVETMAALADSKVGLQVNLDNGAARVIIPGGFTMPTVAGKPSYPLGFQADPYNSNLMRDAVKEADAKTEVYQLGSGTLPTTATVTIKTRLTGKVNIYYWDEATRETTLIASPTVDGRKITFATKQLGNLIFTTGTI